MVAAAVLSVFSSVGWALYTWATPVAETTPHTQKNDYATVELLSLPHDAEIWVDGAKQSSSVVILDTKERHLLAVVSPTRGKWSQVIQIRGSVSLVIDLRPQAETATRPSNKVQPDPNWVPEQKKENVLNPWNDAKDTAQPEL